MSNKNWKQTSAPAADPLVAAMGNMQDPMARKRELLRKVQVLRSGLTNQGEVRNQNPAYTYCWVFNDRQVIDQYAGYTYEVVTLANDPDVDTAFKKEDGRHVRGDSILMRVDKDMAEALNADRDLRALDRIDGAREEFATWGAGIGVPIERGPQHGQN